LREAAAEQALDMKASIAIARETAEAAKKSADAANLSAYAALRVELPILMMDRPSLDSIDGPVPENGAYGTSELTTLPYENCVIPSVNFRNHGRTAAFPTALHIGYCVARKIPPTPVYLHSVRFRGETIIKAADSFEVYIHFDLKLTDHERSEMKAGATMWLWCWICFDTFMRSSGENVFTWKWSRLPEDGDNADAYHFIALRRTPIEIKDMGLERYQGNAE
jgi:hypothetical protein